MKALLDTDTCIDLIRSRNPGILRHLEQHSPGDIAISSITLAELEFGVSKSAQPAKNRAALDLFLTPLELAPFDSAAARAYGDIRAALERKGSRIGPLDTLIGAHALSLGVTLVTHNTREFASIPGLHVADWTVR